MDSLVGWIANNKEWLFSGVAVTVLSWAGLYLFKMGTARPDRLFARVTVHQTSKSAGTSTSGRRM